jgi:hypothetical protein
MLSVVFKPQSEDVSVLEGFTAWDKPFISEAEWGM